MAGKISLTPAELLAQSAEMLALEQEFADLFKKTDSILGQVNSNWSANLANNFSGKIQSAQRASSSIVNMLGGGARIAETSANSMESVDQLLKAAITGGKESSETGQEGSGWRIYESGTQDINTLFGGNAERGKIAFWRRGEGENGFWYLGKAQASVNEEWDAGFHLKDKQKDWDDIEKKSWYATGKEGDTTFYKKEATFFEVNKTASASASIYEGALSNEYGTIYATIGKAEAHASVSGGFYAYNADGKRIFSPGVKAEVGTSVTVLQTGASGQLGSDMLGVTGAVDVTAGKAEAKASIELGAVDGNGRPQLNMEASAEAIAVEAKASVKANVLGGGVEGKVGVNVGIGAHAKVGIKDGVIKCDIGASVGVGVTAEVEIDVGGMVDTAVENAEKIAEAAEDAVEAVSDAAEAAWDEVEEAAEAVEEAAKEVAKEAEKAAKEVAKEAEKAAKEVGKAAKKAAKKAGEALDDFGDWVGGWF